jgi:hypothetical protein
VADPGNDTPYDIVGIGHNHAGMAPSATSSQP